MVSSLDRHCTWARYSVVIAPYIISKRGKLGQFSLSPMEYVVPAVHEIPALPASLVEKELIASSKKESGIPLQELSMYGILIDLKRHA